MIKRQKRIPPCDLFHRFPVWWCVWQSVEQTSGIKPPLSISLLRVFCCSVNIIGKMERLLDLLFLI